MDLASIYIPWVMSKWLRSICCDAPIVLTDDMPMDLDWIYCAQCCNRIGVVPEEDRWTQLIELDNSEAKYTPDGDELMTDIKSLDWYSPHRFVQAPINNVIVCYCGKWPMHHIHTDNKGECACDECKRIPRDVV